MYLFPPFTVCTNLPASHFLNDLSAQLRVYSSSSRFCWINASFVICLHSLFPALNVGICFFFFSGGKLHCFVPFLNTASHGKAHYTPYSSYMTISSSPSSWRQFGHLSRAATATSSHPEMKTSPVPAPLTRNKKLSHVIPGGN